MSHQTCLMARLDPLTYTHMFYLDKAFMLRYFTCNSSVTYQTYCFISYICNLIKPRLLYTKGRRGGIVLQNGSRMNSSYTFSQRKPHTILKMELTLINYRIQYMLSFHEKHHAKYQVFINSAGSSYFCYLQEECGLNSGC